MVRDRKVREREEHLRPGIARFMRMLVPVSGGTETRRPIMGKTASALFIIILYMAVRAVIYARLPATDYASWFVRDVLMTVPRVAMFLLSLLALRGMRGTSWLKVRGLDGAVLLIAVLLGEGLAIASFQWAPPPANDIALLGWITTLAVAFFEETCFRGVLFQSLKERLSPLKAAAVSSLIFTVYHLQAQPLTTWPGIFLVGFSFCAAYYRGAGLIWLVLAHELIDAVYLSTNSASMPRVYLYILAYMVLALTAVWGAFRLRKPFPAGSATAAAGGGAPA